MRIIQSVATNLFFPASRKDATAFGRTGAFLRDLGVKSMEFYCDGPDAAQVGNHLRDNGMRGVYIAVIPLKEKLLHLCGVDEDNRRQAVSLAKGAMEEAQRLGAATVMFNSGRIAEGQVEEGLEALYRSFTELFEHKAKKGLAVALELEPCDSAMDARQLLGPIARTGAFVSRLHDGGMPLMLTLDSAHTSEEGESFAEALTTLRPYCNHIHFANCRISDPQDALYGDKHLGYEYADSVWTYDAIRDFLPVLEDLYPGQQELTIGLEALCREDDAYTYFQKTAARLPELFNQRETK